MKGLMTLILIIMMFGVVVGATATWTYMHFTTGSTQYAR